MDYQIKIMVSDKLIGVVVGPDYAYCLSLWSRWTVMRWKRDKGLGCAFISKRRV